jgi:hypothetical protein
MGLYKLSSQFTDFVKSRSSNPGKILEQVSDAIEDLKDKGHFLPGGYEALDAFHAYNPSSDNDVEFMIERLGGPEQAAPIINKMYTILGELTATGMLDMITRKVIEKFLGSYWKPLAAPERLAPTVIRRKPLEQKPTPVDIKVEERENRSRWSSPEDRMLERLDRKKSVASLFQILSEAGLLEKLSPSDERKIKFAQRSIQWRKIAKVVSLEDDEADRADRKYHEEMEEGTHPIFSDPEFQQWKKDLLSKKEPKMDNHDKALFRNLKKINPDLTVEEYLKMTPEEFRAAMKQFQEFEDNRFSKMMSSHERLMQELHPERKPKKIEISTSLDEFDF